MSWLPNALMLFGAAVWLTGELIGVRRHRQFKNDTTSEWAWALERKFPIVRALLGVFILSLFGHIMFGWWLLP